MATEKQIYKLEDLLYSIKDKVSRANEFAVKTKSFPEDNATRILDLSCMIDDIIGELTDEE